MPYVEMLCMANSRKHGGRCVAGLKTDGSGWVRPVADSEDGTLFPFHYGLEGGGELEPLDIIQVPLKAPRPEKHQPENWIIDDGSWRYVDQAGPAIVPFLKRQLYGKAFLFGDSSDRVPFSRFATRQAEESLALIVPQDLSWQVVSSFRGNRQTRAAFRYRDTNYDLGVTDLAWQKHLRDKGYGVGADIPSTTAQDGRLLLTVSLSEPAEWDDCCYKLVAGVIVGRKDWGATFEPR